MRCPHESWIFEYLIPSWWKIRSCGLAEGSMPLGAGFEASRVILFSMCVLGLLLAV